MNAIVLERLQQETDIQRRGLIFGFPIQVATLKEPIEEILDEIFTTSKFDQRPLLRGVYFASGTQAGAPIDRMMHAMATTFGMELPRQPAFAGQEKSYFLTRLLDSVVFAEANVVAADPRAAPAHGQDALASPARRPLRGAGCSAPGRWPIRRTARWWRRRPADRAIPQRGRDDPAQDGHDTDFAAIVPPLNMLRDGPAELRAPGRVPGCTAGSTRAPSCSRSMPPSTRAR